MVTSQTTVQLLALLVCSAVTSHPSDGARLYGPMRRLGYESLYEDTPTPEDVYKWGQNGLMVDGGDLDMSYPLRTHDYVEAPIPLVQEEEEEDPSLPFATLDELRTLLFSPKTRSRVPTRGYYLPPPSSSSPLLLRDAGPWREEEPRQKRQREEEEDIQQEEEEEEKEEEEEEQRRQIQLYMAYLRPPAPPTSRGGGGGAGERGAKEKRWWSGRRTSGQVDRRASQTKHYDCLKSCIKEGKLHPIQCHTLC